MRKHWKRFKSFIGQYDFADAFKDIADDLKKVSGVFFILWLLSQVQHLPLAFSALPKVLGVDAAALQTSDWVSWLLFTAAIVLYVAQVFFRVKARKAPQQQERHEKEILRFRLGIKNGTPRRDAADCRLPGSGIHRSSDIPQARKDKTASR